MSLVFDVIILAVCVTAIVLGVKRGFIKIGGSAVNELGLNILLSEVEVGIDEESPYGSLCALASLLYFLIKAVGYCNERETPIAPVIDKTVKEIIRYKALFLFSFSFLLSSLFHLNFLGVCPV